MNLQEYSTSEKVVGKWIDGKKIYQKSYVITSNINNTGWNAVPHGIAGGVDHLINAWGGYTFSASSTTWTNINGYFRNAGCLIDVNHANGGDTELGISDSSRTITEAHWTLQYTKITD